MSGFRSRVIGLNHRAPHYLWLNLGQLVVDFPQMLLPEDLFVAVWPYLLLEPYAIIVHVEVNIELRLKVLGHRMRQPTHTIFIVTLDYGISRELINKNNTLIRLTVVTQLREPYLHLIRTVIGVIIQRKVAWLTEVESLQGLLVEVATHDISCLGLASCIDWGEYLCRFVICIGVKCHGFRRCILTGLLGLFAGRSGIMIGVLLVVSRVTLVCSFMLCLIQAQNANIEAIYYRQDV